MNAAQPKSTKTKAATKKRATKAARKFQDVKKLYELGTAFWASGALIAAVKLGIFTRLDTGPLTVEAIARRVGANKRWVEKLLVACAAMGLLEKGETNYRNSSLASQFLVEGKPYYQGAFFLHLSSLWQRFGTLDYTVKTGQRTTDESDLGANGEDGRAWILGSHNVAMSGQAEALARAIDLKDRKRLCDIGGGPGTYSAVLCLSNPGLQATVLDEPEVVPITEELIGRFGLQERVSIKPAQILYDSYGEGYDVVLLSGVLHGLTEANCKKMLRKAYNALAGGGIILIQEMLLDDDEPKPLLPALFSLNMTLGASYTAAEIMTWLYNTGFVKAQVKEIENAPWLDHLIIAKKV
ncbi:MAG: methyltransferase [Acidobacteriota bacterium]